MSGQITKALKQYRRTLFLQMDSLDWSRFSQSNVRSKYYRSNQNKKQNEKHSNVEIELRFNINFNTTFKSSHIDREFQLLVVEGRPSR